MTVSVLVTGATGLVGINLIHNLVADGQRVRALVRKNSPRRELADLDVEFAVGDVTDYESVRAAARGCEYIYHAAGWVQIAPWGADKAYAVNVTGTENVCRASVETGVRRLLHVSSIAAIGAGPAHQPANESSAWNLAYLKSPYFDTKKLAENVVRKYLDDGLDAVMVNPAYIIGPYDVRPSSGRMILLYATRSLQWYPRRGGIGFVDVREVVDAMRLAMEKGKTGERYILSHTNMTYGEFALRIAKLANVPPPRYAMPFAIFAVPCAVGSLVGRWAPQRFADVNLPVIRTCYCEHFVDGEKARRELGQHPRPIDQAIADALSWFEKNAYVERTETGWRWPA